MIINKPYCGFRYCKYHSDGNCTNKNGHDGCEFQYYKKFYEEMNDDIKNEYDFSKAVAQKNPYFEKIKSKNYKTGYKKALEDINKPMKMITPQWSPSKCPRCNKDFYEYEDCDDGYYKRAEALERCPYCGQKITWK